MCAHTYTHRHTHTRTRSLNSRMRVHVRGGDSAPGPLGRRRAASGSGWTRVQTQPASSPWSCPGSQGLLGLRLLICEVGWQWTSEGTGHGVLYSTLLDGAQASTENVDTWFSPLCWKNSLRLTRDPRSGAWAGPCPHEPPIRQLHHPPQQLGSRGGQDRERPPSRCPARQEEPREQWGQMSLTRGPVGSVGTGARVAGPQAHTPASEGPSSWPSCSRAAQKCL